MRPIIHKGIPNRHWRKKAKVALRRNGECEDFVRLLGTATNKTSRHPAIWDKGKLTRWGGLVVKMVLRCRVSNAPCFLCRKPTRFLWGATVVHKVHVCQDCMRTARPEQVDTVANEIYRLNRYYLLPGWLAPLDAAISRIEVEEHARKEKLMALLEEVHDHLCNENPDDDVRDEWITNALSLLTDKETRLLINPANFIPTQRCAALIRNLSDTLHGLACMDRARNAYGGLAIEALDIFTMGSPLG